MRGELISRDEVLKRLSGFKQQPNLKRKKDRDANEHFMNGVRSAIEVIVSEPAVIRGRNDTVIRVKKKTRKRSDGSDKLAQLAELVYKAYKIAYEMAEGKNYSNLIVSVRDLLWLADTNAFYVLKDSDAKRD